jgi:hypothetical protein
VVDSKNRGANTRAKENSLKTCANPLTHDNKCVRRPLIPAVVAVVVFQDEDIRLDWKLRRIVKQVKWEALQDILR